MSVLNRRTLLLGAAASSLALVARPSLAAPDWKPEKRITLVVGFPPGGAGDVGARMIAEGMAAVMGARIVVENRPGATGATAAEWLKSQPADGYTIMTLENSAGAVVPLATIGGTRYDPIGDFVNLGVFSTPPDVLVINKNFAPPDMPARGVIDKLRTSPPGSLHYASSGYGGGIHLKSEMLAKVLGTSFVHVPFPGGAPAMTSIMSGDSQFGLTGPATVMPFLSDNRIRAVALLGGHRYSVLPDLPTFTELGIPGFEIGSWFTVVGPKGLPVPIAETFNAALVQALNDPKLGDRLLKAGHDPYLAKNSLADARTFMEVQYAAVKRMVDETGIRLQP